MIDTTWDNEQMNIFRDLFNSDLPENLYRSHYELSAIFGGSAQDWKSFLTNPFVSDYVIQELRFLKQTEMQKLLKGISDKSRSVGVAQTLTALMKTSESDQRKEGPVFIYSYIPLNAKELAADNAQTLEYDPFKRGIEHGSSPTIPRR